MSRINFIFLLLCVGIFSSATVHAQAKVSEKNFVSSLVSIFLPQGLVVGYDIRDFIASDEFRSFISLHSAAESVDRIYIEALTRAHGGLASAMLGCAVGTFDHYSLPLNLGVHLAIPLTLESRPKFDRRVANLPSDLYRTGVQDRDKLQHFFASAWLARSVGMQWLVDLLGDLVEIGEGAFVTGSQSDRRDITADRDGAWFGFNADSALVVLPSPYFRREK